MLAPQSLILNFQTFRWMSLDSTPFDEYTNRSLLPRVFTRPFDYRLPPNSPHAEINCHGDDPRHQVEFPNTNRNYTEEGNLPEPIHTSHDLVHSTGLLEPNHTTRN